MRCVFRYSVHVSWHGRIPEAVERVKSMPHREENRNGPQKGIFLSYGCSCLFLGAASEAVRMQENV